MPGEETTESRSVPSITKSIEFRDKAINAATGAVMIHFEKFTWEVRLVFFTLNLVYITILLMIILSLLPDTVYTRILVVIIFYGLRALVWSLCIHALKSLPKRSQEEQRKYTTFLFFLTRCRKTMPTEETIKEQMATYLDICFLYTVDHCNIVDPTLDEIGFLTSAHMVQVWNLKYTEAMPYPSLMDVLTLY